VTPTNHVEPGDLITAEFMNQLIDEVNSLDSRLALLEAAPGGGTSTGPPTLTSRSPSGDLQVGDLLTLNGRNFAPLQNARVRLGSATISSFNPGSDGDRLVFAVPASAGTTFPLNTTVTVQTPQGSSNALSVRINERPVTTAGAVYVDDQTPPMGTVVADQDYPVQWRVRSETTAPVQYAFSLLFSDVDPASSLAEWQSAATLSPTSREVGATTPATVSGTVKIPSGANRAMVRFRAASEDGLFVAVSAPILLEEGASITSDPRIQLLLSVPQPDTNPDGQANNVTVRTEAGGRQTVLVPRGQLGYVQVLVNFHDTGPHPATYKFAGAFEGDDHGWTIGNARPRQLTQNAPNDQQFVNYRITAPSSAGTHAARLLAKATRVQADGTTTDFESFVRVAIETA
jgi:hypothetical protein